MFLESFLLLKSYIVLWAVMSPSFFVWWRKKRERMAMIAALLMFMSPFVKEFQFSQWSHQVASALVTRPGCWKDIECSTLCLVCTSGLWLEQTGRGLRLDPLSFLAANIEKGA